MMKLGLFYDWDEKLDNRQKKHEEVIPILNRNSGRLSIAFSSYSFEEWILAHFEHNSTKYYESDCSDSFGHSYMCGSTKANPDNDCHGERCIAGYLRSRGYIPFYSKGDKRIFSNITLKEGKISRKALINASWLRSKGSCFSSDAYTTVDILVCKLMAEDYRCDWCRIGSSFAFSRTTLKIVENDGSYIVQNMGDISIILNSSNIFSTDAGGSMERSLLNIFFLLEPGGCYSIEKNNVDSLLKFSTDNHDVFVELQ